MKTNGQPQGLPHSEECERAVLAAFNVAAIKGRPDAVDRLLEMVSAPMFYLERHQAIFRAIGAIRGRGEAVDIRTLQGELEAAGAYEQIGGLAYLAGLDLDLPDITKADTYAGIIRERWAKREMILALSETTSAALGGGADTIDLISRLQRSLLDIEQARVLGGNFEHISETLLDIDVFTEKPGGLLGLPTGLIDLDKKTHGFQAGQLVVIAGRPSMGKTSLAIQAAAFQALDGNRVGFVSLEDVRERIAYKLLAQTTGIPHERLALGRVTKGEGPTVINAMNRLGGTSLWINDREAQTVEQVCASARHQAMKHGLDILYVDYLNLMNAATRKENRNLEIGYISQTLKNLAKSLAIPVVLLCQLSKKVEDRPDRRPRLSDLRDSGEIEQNADQAIFVFRPEFYWPDDDHNRGVAHLIIDKNKGGERTSVSVVFTGETMGFSNRDYHDEPPPQPKGWSV